jgi:hypothetical protein
MPMGVDASTDCSPIADALVSDGVTFVGRYYANHGKKRLRATEYQALRDAGLKVVSVWEDGRPTSVSYFSFAKGVDDGSSAYHDALSIGQPVHTPIYFAIDYDTLDADLAGGINDYLKGVAVGLKTAANGNDDHPVGVYGSGATCRFAISRGLASYTWLAMSRGWRGFDFSGWNIKQSRGQSTGGVDTDSDESSALGHGGF